MYPEDTIQIPLSQYEEMQEASEYKLRLGSIIHDIMSPIMSISGGLEGLNILISEYNNSINDKNVTEDDHHEIAKDMSTWIVKLKNCCNHLNDCVKHFKDSSYTYNNAELFTVDKLLKGIEAMNSTFLRHEYKCYLKTASNGYDGTLILGVRSILVRCINNMLVNAAHSYQGKGGDILLSVSVDADNIIFKIEDMGQGIPLDIQQKLFKEMITTKGENGSGLGTYMSFSNIKKYFGGDITFKSTEGSGTIFYISIPNQYGRK